MRAIPENGSGVSLYLRQEGRGIGLINNPCLRTAELRRRHSRSERKLGFDADLSDYTICKSMFLHLQADKVLLMTYNPLQGAGIKQAGY